MNNNHRLCLAEDGRTQYKIVIPEGASETLKYAAEELSKYLKEISGAVFPVTTEGQLTQEEEEGLILTGCGRLCRELVSPDELMKLGEEGFLIRTIGKDLVIAGNTGRGTLYGVYGFLKGSLGCRWFTPEVSHIPKRSRLELESTDRAELPALEYREPYQLGNQEPEWHVRNFSNGHFPKITARMGGRVKYDPFVHSFYTLVPPETYFAEHPEYYAQIDGKRVGERAQLCLSNEEVFEIVLAELRARLEKDPEIAVVSVSQNDCAGACTCDRCRKVEEEEGSPAGNMLRFVNRIAEALEKEYPHLRIDTLAYQYTRKPPKLTRPRPNVIVRLCSIECCFSHPLAECGKAIAAGGKQIEGGRSFTEDLEGWGKICNQLYIWDYTTNFANYLQPFPDFNVLQENIRYFIRNHVRGIFEEGNNAEGECGGLNRLRQYLLAQLLWNPEIDAQACMREFLIGYLGMAAPWIEKWIEACQSRVTPEIHMSIYDSPAAAYLEEALLEEGDRIFDCAEEAADNEEILSRVRTARLSLRYVRMMRKPADAPDREAEIKSFFEDVKKAGITQIREWTSLETSEAQLLDR